MNEDIKSNEIACDDEESFAVKNVMAEFGIYFRVAAQLNRTIELPVRYDYHVLYVDLQYIFWTLEAEADNRLNIATRSTASRSSRKALSRTFIYSRISFRSKASCESCHQSNHEAARIEDMRL